MTPTSKYSNLLLNSQDITIFHDLLELFGEVFVEPNTYHDALPRREYLEKFLRTDSHIILVARDEENRFVGGLSMTIRRK